MAFHFGEIVLISRAGIRKIGHCDLFDVLVKLTFLVFFSKEQNQNLMLRNNRWKSILKGGQHPPEWQLSFIVT
jgi:hypothetical protein